MALQSGDQSGIRVSRCANRAERPQRCRDLLQEQWIRLQRGVDCAVLLSQLRLLSRQLGLKVRDVVGEILYRRLVLRQIDIENSLRGAGEVGQVSTEIVGKRVQRGILKEVLHRGRVGRQNIVERLSSGIQPQGKRSVIICVDTE